MLITRTSAFTGKIRTLDLPCTREQLEAWRAGKLIQFAMPRLSASEREFIQTGVTQEEWNDAFNEKEE